MLNNAESAENKPNILLVDDEVNVLSSLKRLFRGIHCKVYTADSGHKGLEILRQHPVDLVISDMRMPEMDGAQFLEQVFNEWPQTIRFLLTGYSDMASTVDAINKGRIHNYMNKPWDDNHLKLSVSDALEKAALFREKERLEKLTQQQNNELQVLNQSLEQKIAERTQALDEALGKLQASYRAMIPSFASLLSLREGQHADNARRVGELAKSMAKGLCLSEDEQADLYYAGILHNIGKLALPDAICNKAFISLTKAEREVYEQFPSIGEQALLSIESLHATAKLIGEQKECVDGSGYPMQKSGDELSLSAKILATAVDYEELQIGLMLPEQLSAKDALEYCQTYSKSRYDESCVQQLKIITEHVANESPSASILYLPVEKLEAGMEVREDFYSKDNILLLASGLVLTTRVINRLIHIQHRESKSLVVYVKTTPVLA